MSDESGNSEEPKIVVDEGWKAQVEKEKQELEADNSPVLNDETATEQSIPPASFQVLMSTLATQAMAGLGFFPDPGTGKPSVNRPLAKHFIDMIGMLEEKTKGNLTPDEAEQTKETLHQLRMIFVSSKDAPATVDDEPEKPPIIELP